MTPFVLSLGSNLGDSRATLADAVARLRTERELEVTGVSGLYRTAPVGGVAQDDFLNAVVVGRTTLTPDALLDVAQRLEQAHHRTREVRWGPRTLDVDVIACGAVRSDDPRLTLPHPRAHERAVVLVPWLEADPDAALPGHGRVAALLAAAGRQGVELAEPAGWDAVDEGSRAARASEGRAAADSATRGGGRAGRPAGESTRG